jgi:hypothetical protein
MRTFSPTLLLLALAAPLSLSGCHGCGGHVQIEGSDVLAGLGVATEPEGQMEGQAVALYSWVRPSTSVIMCIKAPCPTYQIHGVDGSPTRLVHQVDLRALGLSRAQETALYEKLGKTLLRGKYTNWRFQGEDIVVLQVTRYVEAGAPSAVDHPATDQYYQIRITDDCTQTGCLKWQARPLNPEVGAPQVWEEMDLSSMRLTGPQQQVLMLKLRNRGGYVARQPVPAGAPQITQAFPNP